MKKKLIIIAGLCALESEELAFQVAEYLKKVTDKYAVDFIFKASFDKANRTSIDSFRGMEITKAIKLFRKLKEELGIKILTDVHEPQQAKWLAPVVDILQIPAFLCRQTDLVTAIARTGKIVNIKKGQFLAPEDVKHIIKKIESVGNKNIMITERGVCFGYRNLITDYRSFMIMNKFDYPIIFDVTHSQQMKRVGNSKTGGSTEFVIPMAKGAIATGAVSGLFFECHPNPKKSKSDSATSLNLKQSQQLIKETIKLWEFING